MATVVHSASGFARFNPLPGLIAGFDRLAARWQASRNRARELRELFAFSDHDLRDLGLSRSDFMALRDGTYRRE
ncbi:MAG TPA: DUF1127 domain-containing protein [Acetobacteraceae bacterium]|jgi:uncharacterized protein YjiS (DUF1127 family)|nr:DUF1127 domain-containing protein [Acetobacteraceae bacterium]